jgi:hypothetical protein
MLQHMKQIIQVNNLLEYDLGETWTRHCDWNSPFFFTKNNKECTKETHDFLVGTRQNFYIQESLQEENHSVKSQKIYF